MGGRHGIGEGAGAGDLALLEAGSVVPADLRIVEVAQLRVEEAR
jgi:magnesium-transporting ATPase (P-type)